MKLNKLLDKFGIKVTDSLSKEEQIILSDNVATLISNKFNYIDYSYIYEKLVNTKIYRAIIPNRLTKSLYIYEEDILLVSDEENIDSISEELLYECIHTIQDVRDKKGKIKQLGQSIFTDFKVYAMALNEASIQYIVSKVFRQ